MAIKSNHLGSKFLNSFFGIQGYSVKDIETVEGKIELYLRNEKKPKCPICGKIHSEGRYDSKERSFYLGAVNSKPVWGVLQIYRIECENCGIVTEEQRISDNKKSYSTEIGKVVVNYTQYLDNNSTAKLLGLSESMVYRIDKEELSKRIEDYTDNVPADIESIGIDEVSRKRRHTYATIVTNQEDSKVIWLEKGKKQKSLLDIYDKFEEKFDNLGAASMDFWSPFKSATKKKFPDVAVIHDKFHLTRIFNRHIERERRDYQRELAADEKRHIKKHTRWILLRRKAKNKESYSEHLQELKEKNNHLFEMYLLKEDFLSIFDKEIDKDDAKEQIVEWIERAKESIYEHISHFARKTEKRLDTLLNWFNHPISNGLSEGINNVIKSLLKRGYGYKDFDYFRMKVLQKCGYLKTTLTHTN